MRKICDGGAEVMVNCFGRERFGGAKECNFAFKEEDDMLRLLYVHREIPYLAILTLSLLMLTLKIFYHKVVASHYVPFECAARHRYQDHMGLAELLIKTKTNARSSL